MRIAVFGATGMLGKAVVSAGEARHHKMCTPKWRIDIASHQQVLPFLEETEAEAVINCAGVIPMSARDDISMISTNALGPHVLAEWCDYKNICLVHVSTDCVFSGRTRGTLSINSDPDPIDLYGRTKLVGEEIKDVAAVVRTSFIGPNHGLMRWLIDQPIGSEVEGWLGAYWTGSSVQAVARSLIDIAESDNVGLMHLATERIYNKCEIIESLIDNLGLDLKVKRVATPNINRALLPTHVLPAFEKVVEELCSLSLSQ